MKPVRLVIFAKAPLPGLAKTRLSPALGEQGAADLARRLLDHCLAEALAAAVGPVELCVSPSRQLPVWRSLSIPAEVVWSEQGEGDLGERLARAARRALSGGEAVLLLGTDCPGLTAARLRQAARALSQYQACLAPVSDGGYALLGLTRYLPALFADMPWSTAAVAELTRARLRASGQSLYELPLLHDIDEPADLRHLPAALQVVLPQQDLS